MKRFLPLLLLPLTLLPSGGGYAAGSAEKAAPSCDRPTIVGSPGRDRLIGTPGPDVIAGYGGDDVLAGRGGDDLLCGGRGTDVLRGGAGDDVLRGGQDWLERDGRIGWMQIGDWLDGGPGDDRLVPGHDPRADKVHVAELDPDGLGFNQAPGGVTVRLDQGWATGYGEDRLVLRGPVKVSTSAYADLVVGTDRADEVYAGAGHDVVRGGKGADELYADDRSGDPDDDAVFGGAGDDYLYGEEGSDRLSGGAGRDQVSDDGRVGVDRLSGGAGPGDLVTNVMSADEGEWADGGPGGRDAIWNMDDARAHPRAVMTCVRFEDMGSSGRWC